MNRREFLGVVGGAVAAAGVSGNKTPADAAEVVVPPPEVPRVRVLPKRRTRLGWSITTAHHSAHPEYDYEAASRGLTAAQKRMELEIDWSASLGKGVYSNDFDRGIHVAREEIRYDPDLPLQCGWDVPGCPAFAPTQINRYGQWCILKPVTHPESVATSVYQFGERVADCLQQQYASPYELSLDELELVHIGDPAGNMKPQQGGGKRQETRTAFEVLFHGSKVFIGEDDLGRPIYEEKPGWQWRIINGAVDNQSRQQAIRSRLTTILPGGYPALIICPSADEIIRGFAGAYCYPERPDGTYGQEPEKNQVSHVMNALEYCASRLFFRPSEKRKRENGRQQQGYVSQASSQRGRGYR